MADVIHPEVECPGPVEGTWFVYILQSADGAFYVGQTNNLPERIRKHRLGLGSKHTREHDGILLVYFEATSSLSAAIHREAQLEGWSRAKKEALIRGEPAELHRLSRSRSSSKP